MIHGQHHRRRAGVACGALKRWRLSSKSPLWTTTPLYYLILFSCWKLGCAELGMKYELKCLHANTTLQLCFLITLWRFCMQNINSKIWNSQTDHVKQRHVIRCYTYSDLVGEGLIRITPSLFVRMRKGSPTKSDAPGCSTLYTNFAIYG